MLDHLDINELHEYYYLIPLNKRSGELTEYYESRVMDEMILRTDTKNCSIFVENLFDANL